MVALLRNDYGAKPTRSEPFRLMELVNKRDYDETGQMFKPGERVGFYPGSWRFTYLVLIRNPARLALTKVRSAMAWYKPSSQRLCG